MFPKKGKELHDKQPMPDKDREFRQAVAAALKNELGATHQAVKTVMRWTGASERTVKHWFAGSYGPNGGHLVSIARHSDEVLLCFLQAADRPHFSVGLQWAHIRPILVDLLRATDVSNPL
ncbi:hypothetical protein C8N35_102390 [Breoghania corrubedonensis]|uniref:Uncharacterized protein n=1 Tax=Breoghania corrubedonensis TaxID=665038 RepID=A0A2T5VD62_9HYPH|nr:hypothetical protein [Breoghania corrubedonensis]PTW61675.1 hypothetical protein C8N35_102390 [Breoghania corrubedonensis]